MTHHASAGSDSGSGWRSRTYLVVLHTVRLAGFTQEAGIAERARLTTTEVRPVLETLEDQGYVERFSFADTTGWILTTAGLQHDAALLVQDLAGSGAGSTLHRTVAGFEDLNARFVRVVTEWQLQPAGTEAGQDGTAGAEVLGELVDLEPLLADLLADLVTVLPRFARYPAQYREALRRARGGDVRWIAGVGILSCHVVWTELHQDLLSTLGIDRAAGTDSGPE